MFEEAIILILAYFMGSIPFGLLISLCSGRGDIRKLGSGNIGTTNVLRTGGKVLALLTLIADSGKIILAIFLAKMLGFNMDYLVGSASFIGHLFPVWLKFKGGKGVASFLGLGLYLFPKVALMLMATWIITFAISSYSSLAAIAAAIAAIISLSITMPVGGNLFLMITLIILILMKHKENIVRLIEGRESKFSKK
ncbi:MAG: glycerol-3-phosphate 1-O-acyltransferase PlsY [Rickettsiales bacterium]|jgi:glycerol-3-phosphate acyltransferase PlsY|nr:glycerol-3-phosphate 1-O-acyltransferase PlsY [Rickettsiales bacterium]